MNRNLPIQLFSLLLISQLCSCVNGGLGRQPYPYGSNRYDPNTGSRYDPNYGYGGRYSRDDYRYERDRRERHRLEEERRRLERERDRFERDRYNRRPVSRPTYNPPVARAPRRETCPPGFSPSERKCSTKERRRGCKDLRTPSGLGCVKR